MRIAELITRWHKQKWPSDALFVLTWLSGQHDPMTVPQLAKALDLSTTKAYAHIKFLLSQDMLTESQKSAKTRPIRLYKVKPEARKVLRK